MITDQIIGNPINISKQFEATNPGGDKMIKVLKKECKESIIKMLDAFDVEIMKEFEKNVINSLNNASTEK